jgi:hypothetical protein
MRVEDNVKMADTAEQPAVGRTPSVELIYVGFWRRLAAYALDSVILIPYVLLARQLIYTSRSAYLANLIIGTILAIVFEVYLVKRFS